MAIRSEKYSCPLCAYEINARLIQRGVWSDMGNNLAFQHQENGVLHPVCFHCAIRVSRYVLEKGQKLQCSVCRVELQTKDVTFFARQVLMKFGTYLVPSEDPLETELFEAQRSLDRKCFVEEGEIRELFSKTMSYVESKSPRYFPEA